MTVTFELLDKRWVQMCERLVGNAILATGGFIKAQLCGIVSKCINILFNSGVYLHSLELQRASIYKYSLHLKLIYVKWHCTEVKFLCSYNIIFAA